MKRKNIQCLALAMIFILLAGGLPLGVPVRGDTPKDVILLYVGSPLVNVGGEEKLIDSEDYNVTPVLRGSKVFAPLALIGEALGGKISMSGNGSKATLVLDGKTYLFQTNSAKVECSDKTDKERFALETEALMINNRFCVPVKSTVNILGKEYFYDRGLIVVSGIQDIYRPSKDKLTIDALIEKVNNLPVIGTEQRFIELVGKPSQWEDNYQVELEGAEWLYNKAEAVYEAGAADYSQTNIQVEGVDEGDKIKTDGRYIYYAGTNTVSVIQAVPADDARTICTITVDEEKFQIRDLYLEGSKLAVIGDQNNGSKPKTLIYLYDATNPTNVKQVKKTVVDGTYNSSRRVGSYLYVVSHNSLYRTIENGRFITPQYTDLGETVSVKFENIRYFPELCTANYTMITGVDIQYPERKIMMNTYFGGEGKLYVSGENLYMAVADNNYSKIVTKQSAANRHETSTNVYKFSLFRGKTSYSSKMTVPGSVLNQFSMDETVGYFRIATTGNTSRGDTTNGLYVFNAGGELTGKIEGIAVGEQIYSVRYVDERAYMVTFKNTDPLFVIDLRNPRKPAILGALKIPGYSNYLHPYDKNHIIGIGKDTMESNGIAYDKGIKVALFDITDVKNPVEKHVTYIGERGTKSPLLTNHKALLFSKEKNVLAFPVSVMEKEFTFQGAYIYNMSLSGGFTLKGKITHMEQEDYIAAGLNGGDPSLEVDRIIYIGNYFYTFSQNIMKVTANTTYGEVSRVVLP